MLLSGQQALLQELPLRTQLEAAEAEKGDLELQVAEVGTAAPCLRRGLQTASQSGELLQHGHLMRSDLIAIIAIITDTWASKVSCMAVWGPNYAIARCCPFRHTTTSAVC